MGSLDFASMLTLAQEAVTLLKALIDILGTITGK
jgi:hypothetical protein